MDHNKKVDSLEDFIEKKNLFNFYAQLNNKNDNEEVTPLYEFSIFYLYITNK